MDLKTVYSVVRYPPYPATVGTLTIDSTLDLELEAITRCEELNGDLDANGSRWVVDKRLG